MKQQHKSIGLKRIGSAMLGMASWAIVSHAVAGPLDPPAGSIVQTGRPIELVDPRTPIGASSAGASAGTQVIDSPGSYYLTGDIVINSDFKGITISAPDVVLDLNGYRIRSTFASTIYSGIDVTAEGRVTIRNGTIQNFKSGIVSSNELTTLTVEDMRIEGCDGGGIIANHDLRAENLLIEGAAIAIFALDRYRVSDVQILADASQGGVPAMVLAGSFGQLSNVAVFDSPTAGMSVGSGVRIRRCELVNISGTGILANENLHVAEVLVQGAVDGIQAGAGARVERCDLIGIGGIGVSVGTHSMVSDVKVPMSGDVGVLAGRGSIIERSIVNDGNSVAILLSGPGLVQQCSIDDPGNDGLRVGSGAVAQSCSIFDPGAIGIRAENSNIIDCTVVSADATGITGGEARIAGTIVSGSIGNGITLLGSTTDPAGLIDSTLVDSSSSSGHGMRLLGPSVVHASMSTRNQGAGIQGAENIVLSSVVAAGNTLDGVDLVNNASVQNVVSARNSASGISTSDNASLAGVVASNNTGSGLALGSGNVVDAAVASNNNSIGLLAGTDALVRSVSAHDNASIGVSLNRRSVATHVIASENGLSGLSANGDSVLSDIVASENAPVLTTVPQVSLGDESVATRLLVQGVNSGFGTFPGIGLFSGPNCMVNSSVFSRLETAIDTQASHITDVLAMNTTYAIKATRSSFDNNVFARDLFTLDDVYTEESFVFDLRDSYFRLVDVNDFTLARLSHNMGFNFSVSESSNDIGVGNVMLNGNYFETYATPNTDEVRGQYQSEDSGPPMTIENPWSNFIHFPDVPTP